MKDSPEAVVWVEYTGEAKSDLTFRGKNARRAYRFSADPRHRIKAVLESDAKVLLKLSYFRKTTDPRLGGISEHASDMLQAEPTPKAPPEVVIEKAPEPVPVPTPRPKPAPEPEPPVPAVDEEPIEVEPVAEPEPESDALSLCPDITVPDITTMTITEVKSLHGTITDPDQWLAMLYDEQHRADGINPRKMVLEYCEKRIREPVHEA